MCASNSPVIFSGISGASRFCGLHMAFRPFSDTFLIYFTKYLLGGIHFEENFANVFSCPYFGVDLRVFFNA